MSNVVSLPVNGAYAAGRSMPANLDRRQVRDIAFMNYYSAERRAGVDADTAHQRATAHIKIRFDEIMADVTAIMAEPQHA